MKLNVLIFLVLFQLSAFSQKDSIIIKGIVTSTESRTIQNALVHLVSSQGHRYEYKTDSSGAYRFHFYSESAFSCTLTIASDKRTTSNRYKTFGFMASKERAVFELHPGNTYTRDFMLTEALGCGLVFPSILFYPNSIANCNDSLSRRDSIAFMPFADAILFLYTELKENPGMVIELQGHASAIEKTRKPYP